MANNTGTFFNINDNDGIPLVGVSTDGKVLINHLYGNCLIGSTSATGTASQPLQVSGGAYVSGSVGIGTTNPQTLLHTQITSTAFVNGSVANSYPISRFINLSSDSGARGLEIGAPTGSVTSPVYLKVSGTSNRFAILNQYNSESFTVLDNGNLGIGTTNPQTKLDVNGTVTASNFADSTGSYNVNLGSGGFEGRGLVAGYSGGSYGGIGYNVRHTTTGASYVAPTTDASSYIDFYSGGFRFLGAGTGTAGRTLSYNTLGILDSSGNFSQNQSGAFHRVRYTSADNSYSGTFWWNGLALGNNGDNFIVAGRTATGGALKFYVNNTNDITSNTTPGGTLALTLASTGAATFGSSISGPGNMNAWNVTTPGTGIGGIHLGAASGTTNAGPAITFGARDTSSGGNAQAGIYINSDGSYGTRMYFATTDSYATGSKVAMSIDHLGAVTINRSSLIIPNQPSFRAYSPSGAANSIITFGATEYNIGNHMNASTGVFTAPIAGRYLFTFSILCGNPLGTYVRINFCKNGITADTTLGDALWDGLNTYGSPGMAMIFNLAANDTIRLKTGNTKVYDTSNGSFSGCLIG